MAVTNLRRILTSLALVALSGCTVGPDYQRPEVETPPAFKEADGWRLAAPQEVSRAHWWSIYDDPVLDELERQVDVSNQNLKAAEAAYRQAIAFVGEARAAYYPTVTANASALRANAGNA
ncbi:MAG: RND transporter, partial [Acidobacteriota bacterium]